MPGPHDKLAESLAVLQGLQMTGRRAFQSTELSRVHRQRLIANGFLQEVMKGWLISTRPDVRAGDSTPWYASFWEFCGRYCSERFGNNWHLSPEQSVLLFAENNVIPKQVVVYSPRGTNHKIELPFGTSLYDLKQSTMPGASDVIVKDGLRLFSPSSALVKVPESFFRRQPIETQVALTSLRDASDVLRILLTGGNSVKAGVLAGALRRTGRSELADEVLKVMKAAGYDVRESDPFEKAQTFSTVPQAVPPIVARIRAMWNSMRGVVVANFPDPPGLPEDKPGYLESVEDLYKSDAYHSLSIEGYSVTPALVERVQAGNWNPAHHEEDSRSRDALAARGYWQAFQKVKETLAEIIGGSNSGAQVRASHMDWYRELFQPFVAAGVIPAAALAGYRNEAVYLPTSRYVPPRWEGVRDAMPALFELLENETHAGVRAVLGHWLVGYIHPYPDGNGRLARFVMNAMLASGGYPWTVIRVEDREPYLAALDKASIDMDITPFTVFIGQRVKAGVRRRRRRRSSAGA